MLTLAESRHEISDNVWVTVHEASNGDQYRTRRIVKAIREENDDSEIAEWKTQFAIVSTRTSKVDGFDFVAAEPNDALEVLLQKFEWFMNLPRDATQKWVIAATNVGKTTFLTKKTSQTEQGSGS